MQFTQRRLFNSRLTKWIRFWPSLSLHASSARTQFVWSKDAQSLTERVSLNNSPVIFMLCASPYVSKCSFSLSKATQYFELELTCFHCTFIRLLLKEKYLAEFQKIAVATAIGFCLMGFIGFFVKLIHIPINNIIV